MRLSHLASSGHLQRHKALRKPMTDHKREMRVGMFAVFSDMRVTASR
jgi:hypothetical protein